MEYSRKKILYYSGKYYDSNERISDPDKQAISAAYEVVSHLDVLLKEKPPIKKYNQVIPHLLGIFLWYYKEEGLNVTHAVESFTCFISNYVADYSLNSRLFNSTLSKRLLASTDEIESFTSTL